jgi:hypothetical protein
MYSLDKEEQRIRASATNNNGEGLCSVEQDHQVSGRNGSNSSFTSRFCSLVDYNGSLRALTTENDTDDS